VSDDRIFSLVFSAVAFVWGMSEVLISTRLRSRGAGGRRDSGTLQVVLIVAYASVAVAIYIAMADDGYIARFTRSGVLGLALLIAGMAIRAYAILTLRRFFTVDVAIFKDHRLIRAGPYRYIRHPSYTGALLSFYGLAIGFENPWAALIIAVPPTVAFFIRMRVEEAVLRDAFPSEYPEYERATKRLLPFIYLVAAVAITLPAVADETPAARRQTHIEARRLPDAELDAYGALDKAVRAENEKLVFELLNLTGTTFRMWFCGQPAFDDRLILEGMLNAARLSPAQLALFGRWYTAELRFSGHNVAVWRSMGSEKLMQRVECTDQQLASSREWIASHQARLPTAR